MHLQAGTTGWLDAVVLLPDYAVVKAFHMSMLKEAKEAWVASGRDPAKLRTCFRYGDRLVRANWDTWEKRKAHWRTQFTFFLDASAAPYLPFIDWIEEVNEYTATSTWTSPDDTKACLGSVEAAVAVWQDEIRGKRYITHDGVVLDIPDIQLVLCNGPVSNWIHRRYFELAIDTGNRVGYHPYIKWWRQQDAQGQWQTGRDPTDWAEHSGLWNVMEQAHGLKPQWAFTESGLYQTADFGWLHPSVAGGDLDTLVRAMTLWWSDMTATQAYTEGRIDPGMWFTSGQVGWPWYQLWRRELVALATALTPIWRPGVDMADRLSPEKQAEVRILLDKIWAIVTGETPWWVRPVPYKLAPPMKDVQFYQLNSGMFTPLIVKRIEYVMDVFEVNGDYLKVWDRVEPLVDWWVYAPDMQLLGG